MSAHYICKHINAIIFIILDISMFCLHEQRLYQLYIVQSICVRVDFILNRYITVKYMTRFWLLYTYCIAVYCVKAKTKFYLKQNDERCTSGIVLL